MKKHILSLGVISLLAFNSISQTKVELVKTINQQEDAILHGFTLFNERMAFFESKRKGFQLWSTDGTPEGTQMVNEITPFGNLNGAPLVELKGKAYFFAHDKKGNPQLMVKDLTNNNSKEVELTSLPLRVETRFLRVFNDKLYFTATNNDKNQLWMSDGTVEGTQLFQNIEANLYLYTEHNGKFYFTADNGQGFQPWVSDGTPEGTFELKQLDQDLGPLGFTAYKDRLYFSAINDNKSQLWTTDGTTRGTVSLKNIDPQGKSFTKLNGKLYFAAAEGTDGYHLWVTDGTTTGTKLVKRINPKGDSFLYALTEHNGKLYFSASEGNGTQLWISDGTEEGTTLLKTLNPEGDSDIESFSALGNKLYFFAKTSTEGKQLFETDGTKEGTKMVVIDNSFYSIDHPFMLLEKPYEYNDALYFGANYKNRGAELYKITNVSSLETK